MTLFLAYWKPLAAMLVLAGIFYAGAHWQHGRDEAKAAKVAAVQAQRDAIAAAAYAKAVQDRDAAEKSATEANRRIYADLEPRLAASLADGKRLARLLHDALSRASSGPEPAHPDQPGAADAPGVPASQGTIAGDIERATGEAFAACERDSLRLTALQGQIRGQM